MSKLEHLYGELDRKERLLLLLEAFTRRDAAEVDTLAATLPKRIYRAGDPAFVSMLSRLYILALARNAEVKERLLRVATGSLLYTILPLDDGPKATLLDSITEQAAGLGVETRAWHQLFEAIGLDEALVLSAFEHADNETLNDLIMAPLPGFEVAPARVDARALELRALWPDEIV